MHYFGYIEEYDKNLLINRQGMISMKAVFAATPDWAWYDGGDTTTSNVRTYWMTPTLGGGPLTGDLQTPTDPAIKTPLVELLEGAGEKTYGFWAAEKIQYTMNSPFYFVDVLMLASDENDTWALDILKAAPQ